MCLNTISYSHALISHRTSICISVETSYSRMSQHYSQFATLGGRTELTATVNQPRPSALHCIAVLILSSHAQQGTLCLASYELHFWDSAAVWQIVECLELQVLECFVGVCTELGRGKFCLWPPPVL